MEKRKWLWKRRSSERSPGETESSGSMSSHSERYSDDQEAFKASPNNSQSPEVTSNLVAAGEDVNDNVRHLTEKLSAALVNVSAKDDLVKQHSKVAEEAVAGWEKAENELVLVKKQLEDATKKNSALEDHVSHLDGALKECVRQLRQAREEQEHKIYEAVTRKTLEWESTKSELENQLLELQSTIETLNSYSPAHVDPEISEKLEYLESENAALKLELCSQSEELEIRTIERDLSTQAAETASKQNLESIKKVAKLEAECRRLKATACRSSPVNDHKSTAASSMCVESLTDSQSDGGDHITIESDTHKMSSSELRKSEPNFSDSWASALIAELDQFKNEKAINRNASIEIDLMDDFLEMERLAALPEIEISHSEEAVAKQLSDSEKSLRAELEAMVCQTTDLEQKLVKAQAEKAEMEERLENMEVEKAELKGKLKEMEVEKSELEGKLQEMEAEKAELEFALSDKTEHIEASLLRLKEAGVKLEELQREVCEANQSKQLMESQLINMEVETRTMSAKIDALEADVENEKASSMEIALNYRQLENELSRKKLEVELQQTASANSQMKIKQEDLEVAAGKLAECQKTIASLGNQLKSLATLEDFLLDTTSLPKLSTGFSPIPRPCEPWKLHSNETYSPKAASYSSRITIDSSGPSVNKTEGNSPQSSSSFTSSTVSMNHVSSEKNRNGFAKFFSRSKNGMQLDLEK
ncbi:Filament-like plant protein putative isoform 1 [Tripterygium wilfordii]|uniref:Filament-like plant protein putative isoform 1 n=1 Tax=Tripterygium wilfordii TaxID=458696 RepID=A0A7J7CN91_TRIWF|nr:filament-like plant protein [Tripterygium wilfordii]XP_038724950.1 filament-like plant protein [Tripterygium wilfordii]XP_038724951.1 filament-like plant protein [Tripterygium wilfordii]XP_038724953.1 filament-like plant protein [Tripterygium wilfordii]KAF5735511.1 Filament-like plant protein putative isoform 1 [Tripterygium wilfordii]